LPDRDYYLKDDDASAALQTAYRAFVAQMLSLSGVDAAQATADADAIYAFEKDLATFSLPKADLRDPEKIYNPADAAALQALAPQLDFATLAQGLGLSLERPVVLHNTEWFAKAGQLVGATDPATMRAYLRFRVISSASGFLPDAFGQASFAFYGQQIYGQAQRKERWKRCVDTANHTLGDALGRFYVQTTFPGDSKEIALSMVHDIQHAFTTELPTVDWMDEQTRTVADEKAGAVDDKIGYPDTWLDTSAMEISVQPFGANALAGRSFYVHREMSKVGQPVDRTEWFMSASDVNAYYNPTVNEIVFPAGILQPPFFNHAFPAALNYGAMGAVIGHELTHGFDDEGRKFDKTGLMREWWAPEVADRFEERAQCVVDQYDGFEVGEGMHVNGSLTTGENIADLGGVKLAWSAFKTRSGDEPPFVQGLSDDQLFFVAYGQNWCSLMSPELEKMLVTVDPHSPSRYRVIGPLQNVSAFRDAFSCQAGQPMAPQNRCEVW
jgi:Predicted metalloendopeptidase